MENKGKRWIWAVTSTMLLIHRASKVTPLGAELLRFIQTAVARDVRYSFLNDQDVSVFKTLLGNSGVITDTDAVQPYNRDWMSKYEGRSTVVLLPSSTEHVSEVLAYCNLRRLAVVPQGGNTGLVGGSVPVFDEVVVNMSKMNKVISFDKASGALVCEAGCILQSLEDHVAPLGYTIPLDLGAKGSCHIGGNVSTNAGGLRYLRYGSLHGSVLGLEVVLADGTVMDMMGGMRKDNTGYDMKQIFIGAEGTLGIVTGVALQCPPLPRSVQLAFLAVKSFPQVVQILQRAREALGEVLSAVEFLDGASMELVTSGYLPGVVNPLTMGGLQDASAPGLFYMVVETRGSNEGHDKEKLNSFLEEVMEEGLVEDGTVAQSEAQAQGIWRVREGVTEALARRGATYKYDVSLPVDEMYSLVEDMRKRVAHVEGVKVVGYGHVGDGNLHLNISSPTYREELAALLEPYVYEWTTQYGGSISAEHGLGRMKAECIHYSQHPVVVKYMARMKHLFDPNQILNPYKVLPQHVLKEVYQEE